MSHLKIVRTIFDAWAQCEASRGNQVLGRDSVRLGFGAQPLVVLSRGWLRRRQSPSLPCSVKRAVGSLTSEGSSTPSSTAFPMPSHTQKN